MKYRLLVFGVASDIVDGREIDIVAPGSDTTVGKLKDLLVKKYPSLANLNGFILAVNNEYSFDDARLIHVDDEIALIPPTSGG